MAGSFEFFPHFVVEDEVSLRDKNIQDLSEFVLADDELSLLIFIVLIFDGDWLVLCLLLFVAEPDPVKSQLLVVDDHVALDDLLFELLNFLFVHRLDLIVPFKV